MELAGRIEGALERAVAIAEAGGSPPTLTSALRYSLFPGGARVRPRLCLAVALACGDDAPELTDAAAAALEMLHCASLAHDDLPCFDDADLRRGKPSVHVAFGEPIALLAGDALIVMAFEALARAGASHPSRLAGLVSAVGRGVGPAGGIVAGQAWESEATPPIEAYHRAKTGALFVAATTAGAISAGADPAPWGDVGRWLGEAYQVADDLLDAVASEEESGKSAGRDAAQARPSAVARYGMAGAVERLERMVANAVDAVPPCAGAAGLRELVRMQAKRLVPKQLALSAA